MNLINYFSTAAIPIIISVIIIYGIIEKKAVYDIFVDGAKEGIEIVVKIFPTLLGIFVAIGALRSSGIIDYIVQIISPITNFLKIPGDIMPLALIRPISGSASTAIATDIMGKFGVDSKIGLITSTIMGSTETTFYTIAIYTSCVGIKKTKYVLPAALIGDIVRNVDFCSNLGFFVVKFFLTSCIHNDIMYTTKMIEEEKCLFKFYYFFYFIFSLGNF